jgi:hypothetical protein
MEAFDNGNIICTNIFISLAPSILADSSRDEGTCEKKFRRIIKLKAFMAPGIMTAA